jgi:hypothetical protein
MGLFEHGLAGSRKIDQEPRNVSLDELDWVRRREVGKEGRREERKEGRREGGKEGRKEGGKEGRREGGKEGGREERMEGGDEKAEGNVGIGVWNKSVHSCKNLRRDIFSQQQRIVLGR